MVKQKIHPLWMLLVIDPHFSIIIKCLVNQKQGPYIWITSFPIEGLDFRHYLTHQVYHKTIVEKPIAKFMQHINPLLAILFILKLPIPCLLVLGFQINKLLLILRKLMVTTHKEP